MPLNANRPILAAPPGSAAELAPLLKQAISQSGLFYEAHQVEWFAGRFAKADLLQGAARETIDSGDPGRGGSGSTARLPADCRVDTSRRGGAKTSVMLDEKAGEALSLPAPRRRTDAGRHNRGGQRWRDNTDACIAVRYAFCCAIDCPAVANLVQQQLEALATQHFVWQGRAWPGQEMRWEIDEDAARQTPEGEAAAAWSTRMRLSLPHLGEVDARIRLQGNLVVGVHCRGRGSDV